MITSLRHSAVARASTVPSGYVCLACRGKHQLAQLGSRLSSTVPSPSPPPTTPPVQDGQQMSYDTTDSKSYFAINRALLQAVKQAKVPKPRVDTTGDEKTGFVAFVIIGDKKLETSLYSSRREARVQARKLVVQHFQRHNEDAETAAKAPSRPNNKSRALRRMGMRDALKGEDNDRNTTVQQTAPTGLVRRVRSRSISKISSLNMIARPVFPARDRVRDRIYRREVERMRRLEAAREHLAKMKLLREKEPKPRRTRVRAPRKEGSEPKELLERLDGARTVTPSELKQTDLDIPVGKVPGLSYGLDRVLFNPGIYHVQDPRSRVYNFDPYLEKMVDARNFDFAVLDEYRTPSADNTLSTVAEEHKVKYFSSTSNITSVLTHFHYLLSNWRPLSLKDLSYGFYASRARDSTIDVPEPKPEFTKFQRSPTSVYLKPKQGGYAIDKAEDHPSAGLLSFVGQCLEKLFTVPKEVFELYKKDSTGQKPEPMSNGYHYTKFDSILVRSQLDAHDDRLPGSGIFDIKTRAVLPIRMDSLETNQETGKSYEIKNLYGQFESYERELYDMARATMTKYLLQARLGRMDGIFVAYHNIVRMFGFQYLSIADMDKILHGQGDPTLGDAELNASLRILSDVFDHAIALYPNEPLRLYFETRKGKKDMLVLVVPVTEEEINQQHENRQRQSRDYLARLNKSDKDTDGTDNAMKDLLSELEATAAAEEAESSPKKYWSDGNADSDNAAEPSKVDSDALVGIDSIREERRRLFEFATAINMETSVLQQQNNRPDGSSTPPKILKLMLSEITKQTYRLGKDVERIDAALKRCDSPHVPTEEADVERLRKRHSEQLKTNEELYAQASTDNVLSETEIKDMTGVQTLEAAMKASVKQYEVPQRLAAFTVKTESKINGTHTFEPPKVTKNTNWQVTYLITDIDNPADVRSLYATVKKRQNDVAMAQWGSSKLRQYYEGSFFQQLMTISKRGKAWRTERDRLDSERDVVVFEPRG